MSVHPKTAKCAPGVGVGVIILNNDGKILIQKRKGSHAQKYSIPGGHLDLGESFEQAAIREMVEELGIKIKDPKVIAVTNNLETFREEHVHHISIILLVKKYTGKAKIIEPEKCEELIWCDPKHLPQPHFDASRLGVSCFLDCVFYGGL